MSIASTWKCKSIPSISEVCFLCTPRCGDIRRVHNFAEYRWQTRVHSDDLLDDASSGASECVPRLSQVSFVDGQHDGCKRWHTVVGLRIPYICQPGNGYSMQGKSSCRKCNGLLIGVGEGEHLSLPKPLCFTKTLVLDLLALTREKHTMKGLGRLGITRGGCAAVGCWRQFCARRRQFL